MTETLAKVIMFAAVAAFVAICHLWRRPVTDCGKLSLKLCVVNAAGWLIILPMSGRGHPPPFLFPALLFWLLNLLLLPAAATVLWVCHKSREESASYLTVASVYVVMNIAVLYILPLIGVVTGVSR